MSMQSSCRARRVLLDLSLLNFLLAILLPGAFALGRCGSRCSWCGSLLRRGVRRNNGDLNRAALAKVRRDSGLVTILATTVGSKTVNRVIWVKAQWRVPLEACSQWGAPLEAFHLGDKVRGSLGCGVVVWQDLFVSHLFVVRNVQSDNQ